jgi:SMC interacting uncharacterized protein involved in chromosome segregation
MSEMDNINGKEIVHVGEFSLEEKQMLEQIYTGAGLEPVVEAGIKDYDGKLQAENKLLNKVLGTRGSDIKGYGEAVAKRVAFAVYQMLNRQYGGKMGDLSANINALQDERDRARDKYDDLMGRVVGILGEEYKNLRTDSKEFMEKLNVTLGEDLAGSRIDQKALAETLADIDGLRASIKQLEKEKELLAKEHAEMVSSLKADHQEIEKRLQDDIKQNEVEIKNLEENRDALEKELSVQRGQFEKLKESASQIPFAIKNEEIGEAQADDLYKYLVKDSKVPNLVLEGVGKFIDFKKYLKAAVSKGAEEAALQAEAILKKGIEE